MVVMDAGKTSGRQLVGRRLGILILIALLLALVAAALPSAKRGAMKRRNHKTARSLLLVIRAYEHDGRPLPGSSWIPGQAAYRSLMARFESDGYLDSTELLDWSDPESGHLSAWIYVPLSSFETEFSRRPVLISPEANREGRFTVAYAGGHVGQEAANSWQEIAFEGDDRGNSENPKPGSNPE